MKRLLPTGLLRFACVVMLMTGAFAPPQSTSGGEALAPERQPQQSPEKAPVPVFEFHSGFWTNLHHFLYQQARAHNSPGGAGKEIPLSTAALTADEKHSWAAALDYYSNGFADRDLLFNGDMVLINDRLAEMEACADLSGHDGRNCASGLRPELIAALERAAPVYRARWWPQHDRTNRAWIASVAPLVRQYGARLAQQLAEAYEATWPSGLLRVDVVNYGGPNGAYTTLEPAHITISSADPRNQGPAALEIVFHEASHTLAGAVRDAIARECRQRGKPIPRDLWHALLFYTTGEMVKRALKTSVAANGQTATTNYTPYAFRNGLYDRGWSTYERALELYWQPYLDGRADFGNAVARLVSAL
jgi:hypothetical protein